MQPDADTWIANLGSLPLIGQPGERLLYNTGASVLGVLCARAAKMPFADVLRTRIFEPLRMHDTAFYAADTARLLTSYVPGPDGLSVRCPGKFRVDTFQFQERANLRLPANIVGDGHAFTFHLEPTSRN